MTSFLPVSVQGITFQNINRRAQPRRTEDRALQHMRSLLACLEHIGDGMILLDPHLRVDYMTGSASGLLKTCKDQISVQNGQLILSDPGKARHLREFAKKAFSSDVGCGGGIFFIDRPPAEPLIASLFALSPIQDPSMERQLLLILRDPGHRCEPNWICFAERFGLTKAELRLCIALANDSNIAEYSKKSHISLHTARSHLKRIFEKTATHRQAQLLQLIYAFVHS